MYTPILRELAFRRHYRPFWWIAGRRFTLSVVVVAVSYLVCGITRNVDNPVASEGAVAIIALFRGDEHAVSFVMHDEFINIGMEYAFGVA